MIVYSASKQDFLDDVELNQIHHQILAELKRKAGIAVGKSEIESWRNSMQYMYKVLQGDKIPGNAGVAIEYTIPLTSKRVDFILSGQNADKHETAVIVELKSKRESCLSQMSSKLCFCNARDSVWISN